MIPPVFKRTIHYRLIRRIAIVCLLAMIVSVAAACFVEYRRLDTALLDDATKESILFTALFADYHESPSDERLEALRRQLAVAMERTSFIHAELFSTDTQPLVHITRENGAEAAERFGQSSVILPLADRGDGVHLFAHKQLFFLTSLPIRDSAGDKIIGHFRGIYRVSLRDLRTLFVRIGATIGVGAASALFCGILLYPAMVLLSNHLIRTSADCSKANNFLLRTLGAALAKSDVGEIGHHHRVLIYSVKLAEQQRLKRERIRDLIQGACLHDLGMLRVDASILLKPGTLTEKEYRRVQKHVKTGVKLVKKYRWLQGGVPVVACHQEKYDGSGYPAGLAHEKLPLLAKIFTIADSFDALTSRRPYREALPLDDALRTLEQGSGTHFDPVLLSAFVTLAPALYGVLAELDYGQLEKELDDVLAQYLKI